jgi:membrane-associated protease RseP (regulator of RpoE activity)
MDKQHRTWLIQGVLFIVVFFTTTFAGAEWIHGSYVLVPGTGFTWDKFVEALNFSVPFLLILTVHEFGHYIVARIHKVSVTLPYYIPLWFGFLPLLGLPILPSIGTGGALIRITGKVDTKKKFFDIGIAGPLAGFAVALAVLYYGFTHLPPQEYIYEIQSIRIVFRNGTSKLLNVLF